MVWYILILPIWTTALVQERSETIVIALPQCHLANLNKPYRCIDGQWVMIKQCVLCNIQLHCVHLLFIFSTSVSTTSERKWLSASPWRGNLSEYSTFINKKAPSIPDWKHHFSFRSKRIQNRRESYFTTFYTTALNFMHYTQCAVLCFVVWNYRQ